MLGVIHGSAMYILGFWLWSRASYRWVTRLNASIQLGFEDDLHHLSAHIPCRDQNICRTNLIDLQSSPRGVHLKDSATQHEDEEDLNDDEKGKLFETQTGMNSARQRRGRSKIVWQRRQRMHLFPPFRQQRKGRGNRLRKPDVYTEVTPTNEHKLLEVFGPAIDSHVLAQGEELAAKDCKVGYRVRHLCKQLWRIIP